MSNSESSQQTDVNVQVFEKFLIAMKEAGISAEVVQRLKKTLVEEGKSSDKYLKNAIFPEEIES